MSQVLVVSNKDTVLLQMSKRQAEALYSLVAHCSAAGPTSPIYHALSAQLEDQPRHDLLDAGRENTPIVAIKLKERQHG